MLFQSECVIIMNKPQVKHLIIPLLTIELCSDDKVVVLEKASSVQMLVRHKRAPAKVFTAVALAAFIPHGPRSTCWLVPAGVSA